MQLACHRAPTSVQCWQPSLPHCPLAAAHLLWWGCSSGAACARHHPACAQPYLWSTEKTRKLCTDVVPGHMPGQLCVGQHSLNIIKHMPSCTRQHRKYNMQSMLCLTHNEPVVTATTLITALRGLEVGAAASASTLTYDVPPGHTMTFQATT